MKITKNSVVSIHYTLTNDAGEVLDSSSGRDPLKYLQGSGNIIIGLEEALEGKSKGHHEKVTIAPEKAYGVKDDALIQQVPRTHFDPKQPIEPGMQFRAQTEAGPVVVTVTKVDDQLVTLDANHPLAGVTLHFDVEVTDVAAASDEEIAHGHVH